MILMIKGTIMRIVVSMLGAKGATTATLKLTGQATSNSALSASSGPGTGGWLRLFLDHGCLLLSMIVVGSIWKGRSRSRRNRTQSQVAPLILIEIIIPDRYP